MIKKVLGSFLINLFALHVASTFIGGFTFQGDWKSLLALCVGFTFVHLLLKPILDFIFKPLNFLTLGLVGFVIDAAILYAITLYFPALRITPWDFPGIFLSGITVPARSLGVIEVTLVSSFAINIVRSILLAIFY